MDHLRKPLGYPKLTFGQTVCAAIAVAQKEGGYFRFGLALNTKKFGDYLHANLHVWNVRA
jgi:hypothetical protein